MRVVGLRVEYHDQPLGLDLAEPRLFWRLQSDVQGDRQTAWRVLVASSLERLIADQGDLWDSGSVDGDQTTHVPYGGTALTSRQSCHWKVQAWDADGQPSGWSEPASWTMGLLERSDWVASAIGHDAPPPPALVREELSLVGCDWLWLAGEPAEPGPAVFRYRLNLPQDRRVRRAELLLTADPGFEVMVNGAFAGHSDAPPDTWIRGRLLDVTRLMGPGENTLAVRVVAEGPKAGLIGRLEVVLEDGHRVVETLGENWRAAAYAGDDWGTFGLREYKWQYAATVTPYAEEPWKVFPFSHPVVPQPCPYLRRSFRIDRPVKRATAYVTALGLYELRVNGGKVGTDLLRPGWTDYAQRLPYQTYDVTAAMRDGENVIGAVLADGWYAGHVAFMQAFYGQRTRLVAQLELEFQDGTRQTIATDGRWVGSYGALQYADLLHGEAFDARREPGGWDGPNFDAAAWQPVTVEPLPDTRLEWFPGSPPRRIRDVKPLSVKETRPGQYVFDLGQNLVGWVRLKVNAPAGTLVRLQFAEMLNPDGTLYLTNLRSARALDTYVCRGGGVETWEPRFTFHGFRYVEVVGLPKAPGLDAVTGVVVHSDMPQTGHFECSSELLNKLQHNIEWGQRGNYLEVPTDCPQRDERMGWTGDAQVFVRTGCFNFDVAAFFTKWLADLDDAQDATGIVTDVAPRLSIGGGSAAWGDAAIVCPWTIYQCYGDRAVLARHYPMMTRWLAWQTEHSTDGVRPAGGYGDWLQMDCTTPSEVIQTAWYAHGTALVARIAEVLGHPDDAAAYTAQAAAIREAFCRAFVTPDGRVHGDTQCAYVLALEMDLLPEELRPLAAGHLADRLRDRDVRLSTGFVGTPYLCSVLARHGQLDLAYELVQSERFPSWGYSIVHGATTMWERWDGWTAETGFQTPNMNSFNHYAYGAIGSWLYQVLAGLDLDDAEPGYRHLLIRPRPGGGITWAKAELQTLHGRAAVSWKLDAGRFRLEVTVPTNCRATVRLPAGGEPLEVGSGTHTFEAEA